ncbi:MAG: 16S rRNA (cytidine(1402)-2'-O)-methyltransferase [Burkholderiales bacterium]
MDHGAAHGKSGEKRRATLYVVATPIGNLGDVSQRALETLRSVDVVAAEDTRVTGRLLAHYGITRRLIPVHEHNERHAVRQVLDLLSSGLSVALTCDAGTPTLSDPGALLVAAVRDAGHAVTPVPGPNAAVAALSAAGLAAPHHLFYGFLPPRAAARRRALAALAPLPYTLVFYEAPHRVEECVADLRAVLGGDRRIVLARELTKLFESIHACTLAEAGHWLAADPVRRKGEFVLVVEGAEETKKSPADNTARRVLAALIGELPPRKAVALAAQITGGSRRELYKLALQLKKRDS